MKIELDKKLWTARERQKMKQLMEKEGYSYEQAYDYVVNGVLPPCGDFDCPSPSDCWDNG